MDRDCNGARRQIKVSHARAVVGKARAVVNHYGVRSPQGRGVRGRRKGGGGFARGRRLCVDMSSPKSPLVGINLKSLLNVTTLGWLSTENQRRLSSLLPDCDQFQPSDGKHSCVRREALNNEFFSKACVEWIQRLAQGEFKGSLLSSSSELSALQYLPSRHVDAGGTGGGVWGGDLMEGGDRDWKGGGGSKLLIPVNKSLRPTLSPLKVGLVKSPTGLMTVPCRTLPSWSTAAQPRPVNSSRSEILLATRFSTTSNFQDYQANKQQRPTATNNVLLASASATLYRASASVKLPWASASATVVNTNRQSCTTSAVSNAFVANRATGVVSGGVVGGGKVLDPTAAMKLAMQQALKACRDKQLGIYQSTNQNMLNNSLTNHGAGNNLLANHSAGTISLTNHNMNASGFHKNVQNMATFPPHPTSVASASARQSCSRSLISTHAIKLNNNNNINNSSLTGHFIADRSIPHQLQCQGDGKVSRQPTRTGIDSPNNIRLDQVDGGTLADVILHACKPTVPRERSEGWGGGRSWWGRGGVCSGSGVGQGSGGARGSRSWTIALDHSYCSAADTTANDMDLVDLIDQEEEKKVVFLIEDVEEEVVVADDVISDVNTTALCNNVLVTCSSFSGNIQRSNAPVTCDKMQLNEQCPLNVPLPPHDITQSTHTGTVVPDVLQTTAGVTLDEVLIKARVTPTEVQTLASLNPLEISISRPYPNSNPSGISLSGRSFVRHKRCHSESFSCSSSEDLIPEPDRLIKRKIFGWSTDDHVTQTVGSDWPEHRRVSTDRLSGLGLKRLAQGTRSRPTTASILPMAGVFSQDGCSASNDDHVLTCSMMSQFSSPNVIWQGSGHTGITSQCSLIPVDCLSVNLGRKVDDRSSLKQVSLLSTVISTAQQIGHDHMPDVSGHALVQSSHTLLPRLNICPIDCSKHCAGPLISAFDKQLVSEFKRGSSSVGLCRANCGSHHTTVVSSDNERLKPGRFTVDLIRYDDVTTTSRAHSTVTSPDMDHNVRNGRGRGFFNVHDDHGRGCFKGLLRNVRYSSSVIRRPRTVLTRVKQASHKCQRRHVKIVRLIRTDLSQPRLNTKGAFLEDKRGERRAPLPLLSFLSIPSPPTNCSPLVNCSACASSDNIPQVFPLSILKSLSSGRQLFVHIRNSQDCNSSQVSNLSDNATFIEIDTSVILPSNGIDQSDVLSFTNIHQSGVLPSIEIDQSDILASINIDQSHILPCIDIDESGVLPSIGIDQSHILPSIDRDRPDVLPSIDIDKSDVLPCREENCADSSLAMTRVKISYRIDAEENSHEHVVERQNQRTCQTDGHDYATCQIDSRDETGQSQRSCDEFTNQAHRHVDFDMTVSCDDVTGRLSRVDVTKQINRDITDRLSRDDVANQINGDVTVLRSRDDVTDQINNNIASPVSNQDVVDQPNICNDTDKCSHHAGPSQLRQNDTVEQLHCHLGIVDDVTCNDITKHSGFNDVTDNLPSRHDGLERFGRDNNTMNSHDCKQDDGSDDRLSSPCRDEVALLGSSIEEDSDEEDDDDRFYDTPHEGLPSERLPIDAVSCDRPLADISRVYKESPALINNCLTTNGLHSCLIRHHHTDDDDDDHYD